MDMKDYSVSISYMDKVADKKKIEDRLRNLLVSISYMDKVDYLDTPDADIKVSISYMDKVGQQLQQQKKEELITFQFPIWIR